MRLVAICSLVATLGCSSSDFEVATPSTEDSGVETTSEDTAAADAVVPIEDAPPLSDAPCSSLGAATTIYVDARTTRPSVGTAECPTKTIAEALAILARLPPAKRTVRIAGSTLTPLVYNETSLLTVKPSTAIVGSGVSQVTVTGGGACGATTCVFVLEGGTSIEGITIRPGAAVGLALGPTAGTTTIAKNVTVSGGTLAASAAVYVNGAGTVEIGPELRAKDNAGVGLIIETILSARVNAFFNDNGGGIVVKGGVVNIEGGTALRNKTTGVALLSNAKHTIMNFDVRDNLANGIFVDGNAHLKMRATTVVKNRVGLQFRFGSANELDLGTSVDNGKNVFGGPSALNSKAAICLPVARALKAPAVGNKWFVCEPTRLPLAGGSTCEGLSTYQDVYYLPVNTGDPAPLDWSACDVGP
jgi:hypothetical protein